MIADVKPGWAITVQLRSGTAVRFSQQRELVGVAGASGGVEVSSSTGIQQLWWVGPVWAVSTSGLAVLVFEQFKP